MAGTVPARIAPIAAGPRATARAAAALARHGTRFSWLCWGFLYAFYLGTAAVTIAAALAPGSALAAIGTGGQLLLATPLPLALLVLGLLEIRECDRTVRGTRPPGSHAPRPVVELESVDGWTGPLVEAQKTFSQAKHEIELSFLPLVIGAIGFGSSLGIVVGFYLGAAATASPALDFLFDFAPFAGIGLVIVLLGLGVWALWVRVHGWLELFQERLDRQARDLTQLEAEFLWRFAGAPA